MVGDQARAGSGQGQAAGIVNALSFDIEDWFHLVEVDAVGDSADWPALPSLVEARTEQILELCDEYEVRATFYVLGWVAERYPGLVRKIAVAGHELGTHSFWHRRVTDLDAATFREDLHRSITAIEDAAGERVTSFRAPSFSITPGTEWAFDELLEAGLDYDASLFPVPRENGGYPCPMEPHVVTAAPSGRPIPELPMSLMRLGPLKVGFSGGGYLRVFPEWVLRRGIDALHRRGVPAVVYLHPRDFAPDCPRVPMPARRRFKTYVGLRSTERKLRMLLETYRFGPCGEVVARATAGGGEPAADS